MPRLTAVLVCAMLLGATSVAAALAQETPTVPDPGSAPSPGAEQADQALQNPGQTCAGTTNQTAGCDTEFTPIAKDGSGLWRQVGGARFGGNGALASGSYTPYTVDLYAVDFLDQYHGFAGGAACPDDTSFDQLDTCTRVPVIWAYTDRDGEGPLWREVYRGHDPGFVGAISYFARDKALAVGGTGRYPYREFSNDSTSDPDNDPSGKGAVWQLQVSAADSERWVPYGPDELPEAPNLSSELPDPAAAAANHHAVDGRPYMAPMRALTAVDCRHDIAGDRCVAGGLQQLFLWRDGTFEKAYGNGSPDLDCVPSPAPCTGVPGNHSTLGGQTVDTPPVDAADNKDTEVSRAVDFRFRVRSLDFVPGDNPPVKVVGVTSGCCDPNPANDVARALNYDGTRWAVRPLIGPTLGNDHERQTLPDSWYDVDAYYFGSQVLLSAIASPGGPESPADPASRVVGGAGGGVSNYISDAISPLFGQPPGTTDLQNEVLQPNLSDARLVAGDGDVGRPGHATADTNTDGGPDGFMDWTVGSSRSTDQGLAYTTLVTPHGVHAPSPLDCDQYIAGRAPDPSHCQAPSQEALTDRTRSHGLLSLDSYGLNDFVMAGSSGVGWAVGDRGAIEQLGGSGSAGQLGAEPKPPRLGHPSASADPGTSPYGAAAEPLSDQPGSVPALGDRADQRSQPGLVQTGSPNVVRSADLRWDDATAIVSSRDGSEAWALGAGRYPAYRGPSTTLWHFDGAHWSPCDPDGVEDQLEPDPACASLAPLVHYTNAQRNFAPVSIKAAARVPLENDSDPTNDDEFEIVAIGADYQPPGASGESTAVLVYRDGRWAVDPEAMKELAPIGPETDELAFTSPTDGWVVNRYGELFHFDGEHWTSCHAGADATRACGDDPNAPRLPPPGHGGRLFNLHLTTVGERVYMYGGRDTDPTGTSPNGPAYPLIIYKDPGEQWTDGSGAGEDGGGLDPGCASHDPQSHACVAGDGAKTMRLDAFSVAQDGNGKFDGWASGVTQSTSTPLSGAGVDLDARGVLMHLGEQDGHYSWEQWTEDDASADYGTNLFVGSQDRPRLLTLPGPDGPGAAFLAPTTTDAFNSDGPLLMFDPARERWVPYRTPFLATDNGTQGYASEGKLRNVASDGRGGAWIAVRRMGGESGFSSRLKQGATFFYRYTNEVPRQVFSDVPNPITDQGQAITGTATGGDGSFWLSTRSGSVYRYDRRIGWQRIGIPGWDPGRVVTRPSRANAVAVGPDGRGIVVGEGGRIADVGPAGGILDAAAGVSCSVQDSPCGTGRGLLAAAVAPDGSALAGGEARTLLWRPPGGSFQATTSPPANLSAAITSISMPSSGQAWLTTDTGQVFSGTGGGGGWNWRLENTSPDGTVLSTGTQGSSGSSGQDVPLNAISVNADGFGFAVGDQGMVLERSGDGAHPWRRLADLPLSDYTSVALPPGGGRDGALIGGEYGLILTLERGQLEIAHQQDPWDPVNATQLDTGPSQVVGLGLIPGTEAGQVEAWAAEQAPAEQSDRKGAALGTNRTPAPNAVLHYSSDPSDPLLDGGVGRVTPLMDSPRPPPDAIALAAFGKSDCLPVEGGPCPAPLGSNTFTDRVTADVAQRLGGPDRPDIAISTGDVVDAAGAGSERDPVNGQRTIPSSPVDRSLLHRRWVDSVAARFSGEGVPLLGALGGQDLSRTAQGQGGSPIPWEKALAGMAEPWGRSGSLSDSGDLSFAPVENPGAAGSGPDAGAASTHYAVDLVRDGHRLVRIVVLDTSLKSLTAGDALQNPADDQTNWLRSVLCRPGEATAVGASCTRDADERAVVVSEAPTYSYGPAANETLLASDSASLEALLLQYHVDLVVSGRLGWNGLYYTLDAGLHSPQPGEGYPGAPPQPVRADGQMIANVVSSGAGGTFAQGASSAASDGYWHGFSMIHLDPASGAVTVEQRPILDWLRISAATHTMRAGKRLVLHGEGREPPGTDQPLRYDEISTPAITHRFELLQADPERPWLPRSDDGSSDDATEPRSAASQRVGEADPCGPYLCLDSKIAQIDDHGQVKAGNGDYPRTFAIAALSVGNRSATYPLVFEPRASYRPPRPAIAPPVAVPAPPPAAAPPPAQTPTASAPPAPVLPVLAAQAPPPPPAPPAPPTFASQAPIDLSIAPTAIDVAPPTAVSQPPTPPVNPAPPSGARREARQRQAAAQKSGADSEGEGSEAQQLGGDLANDAPGASGSSGMSRHEFTARHVADRGHALATLASHDQPSAWTRDLLLGGGLGIAALVLALGLTSARPTPRVRRRDIPAPARAQASRRR